MSNDSWNFKTKEDLIQIEYYETEILGTTNEGKIILETLEEGRNGHLWKKGEPDNEGFFSLENSQVSKVMTAISTRSLEVKGNITLKWIFNRDYVRGGAEGALAPLEFEGSERRTEGETDNPLLIAPSESKS